MPTTIIVPQLGESVVEGTIGKWLKKVGDPIAKDEPIVEIITDKINIELPAPNAGTLGKITVGEGVVAQVGDELGVILAAGESLGASAGAPAAAPSAPAPSPAAPAPSYAAPAPAAAPSYAAPSSATATLPAPPSTDGARLSPAVRKLVKEHGVDVAQIRGSGMAGRVTREDVLTFIEARKLSPGLPGAMAMPAGGMAPAMAAPAAAAPAPRPLKAIPAAAASPAGSREEVVQPLTTLRKKIAENMSKSRHTAAHCSVTDEVDMTALVELRGRLKEKVKADYGVNLTYMPFITKAVVRALKEYPVLNASITETEAKFKKYYSIGMAVHRDQGLIVPILHDADKKSILQIASEMEDLASRARAEKLTLNDIQGGTFTITNAGMFGATASQPVINVPEVGILGVHLIQERAVVRDHRIVVRWMMTVVLSFDHRLVDGTPAAQFLHRVKELLEDPESWLLDSI
ncbi:MAG TPA: dihydrolipoamide acetyltransferase family protein [Candidatus Eisenbacteria bacterium]|nr:dihydrolipoamide acetyltransferase family protein [Candidatus Eisenbacteria bacterium]